MAVYHHGYFKTNNFDALPPRRAQLRLCEAIGDHPALVFVGLDKVGLGGHCLTKNCLNSLLGRAKMEGKGISFKLEHQEAEATRSWIWAGMSSTSRSRHLGLLHLTCSWEASLVQTHAANHCVGLILYVAVSWFASSHERSSLDHFGVSFQTTCWRGVSAYWRLCGR